MAKIASVAPFFRATFVKSPRFLTIFAISKNTKFVRGQKSKNSSNRKYGLLARFDFQFEKRCYFRGQKTNPKNAHAIIKVGVKLRVCGQLVENMKHYLIDISWFQPYPKTATYRIIGSSFSVAVGKALRQFRRENKGRKIKSATIKFQMYGLAKNLSS
jgi:hypothetical protein